MKNNSLEESNVDRVRRLRDEKRVWKKPLPPTPFLLHLNIIARTQYIDEYLSSKNTIKTECEKFLDISLGNIVEPASEIVDEEKSQKILSTKEENETLEFIMSDLLRLLS